MSAAKDPAPVTGAKRSLPTGRVAPIASSRKPARRPDPDGHAVLRSISRIDDLDRALVERLRVDGRASNRSLAAALEVNEGTVANRLRRMEEGSIMRVVALTDMEAFGHHYFAIAKIRVAGRSVLEVGDELAELAEGISVTVTTGRFDLLVSLLAHDRSHLSELMDASVRGIRGVEHVRADLALRVLKFESMWALLGTEERPTEPRARTEAIDDLDLSIVRLLQTDARGSNRRIATELDVSEGTVRSRIKRMEDERLIRIQAISDVGAFGWSAHAYIGIHVEGGRTDEVGRRLTAHPAIAVLVRSLGEFDLIAVLQAQSREALVETILGEIGSMPGVTRTETFESVRTLKHSYTWARLVD